ncbi:MAG TPA: 2-dehydropantoate 2-reductase [Burkholderiales bacterium]|nr:2-dehydropantoate 2-reductase [Burkholderiales bacterium]
MKVLVMGAGGVGGYFGARLLQAGCEVIFIARGRHLEVLQKDGLTLKSPLGDTRIAVKALQDPAQAGRVEVVLFCVKLWDTEGAAEQVKPVIGPETIVIPFQNGVESIERLRKVLPEKCVMGGSAYIGTRIASPGVIEHTGTMARIRFGALVPAQRQPAERFLAACRKAGFGAELEEDIVSINWEKFIFLVALSSATAVARAPLGMVRSDPDLRWLFEEAMRETYRLALARNAKLPPDFVDKQLAFADSLPAEMRASLLHDLQAGGRLEAPWLCGAVARMSREAGLDAPVNHAVYAALKPYIGGSEVQAR